MHDKKKGKESVRWMIESIVFMADIYGDIYSPKNKNSPSEIIGKVPVRRLSLSQRSFNLGADP